MRKALLLGLLSGTNILIIFAYQWFVITGLGADRLADAFFASLIVPQLILSVISGSVVSTIVPVLATQQANAFSRTAWSAFTCSGAAFLALGAALVLSAGLWTPLIVPGFDAEAAAVTVRLAPAQFANMVFGAQTWITIGVNHAQNRFYRVEVAGIAAGLSGLGLLVWGMPRYGVEAAAWALAGKSALHLLLISPALGRFMRPALCDKGLRTALSRLRPLIAGNAYFKSGNAVDRFLASMAPAGDMSLLHMGAQMYAASEILLAKSIAAPALPAMSTAATNGEWSLLRRITARRTAALAATSCAGLVVLAVAGLTLFTLVFAHRELTAQDTHRLWTLCLLLGGVGVGAPLGQILANGFYAVGDTVTPTRIGVFGFTVGICAKVAGFYWAGVMGIAIGTSFYYLLNAALLGWFLYRTLSDQNAPSMEGRHAGTSS